MISTAMIGICMENCGRNGKRRQEKSKRARARAGAKMRCVVDIDLGHVENLLKNIRNENGCDSNEKCRQIEQRESSCVFP